MTNVQIVEDLEKKIEAQQQWIATLGIEKTRLQERDEMIEANRTINDDALDSFVNFTDAYQSYLKEVTSGKGATKNFAEEIAALIDAGEVTRDSLKGLVNEETLEQFDGYVNNLNAVARAFDDVLKFGPPVSDTFRQYSDALRTANDESKTAEQREAARGLAVAKSAQALEEYTAAVKKAGTDLTDEQIAVEFGIIQQKIQEGTIEVTKFENGVLEVADKVRGLNNEIEYNASLVEKAFNAKYVQKFINTLQTGIQQLQEVLGAFQQTATALFDAQFDTLEKRYARVQEGIVGNTVEANKKRLEAEKVYQEERIKLEKRAAKTQLGISLAQSLANTAEAITRVFAQTGVGGIIAGSVVAAASAAQSAIIANQLATIDNYQRGGIMKRQGGGFVTGPSHEMGGVKFQGGGVELEGNEAVINRVSTINYMGLLDQINQAGGGRPISSLANESRLIEAIAKQRSTPIRAYVVESDITAKQETARRLERLRQF
jgi:hypothetical protein